MADEQALKNGGMWLSQEKTFSNHLGGRVVSEEEGKKEEKEYSKKRKYSKSKEKGRAIRRTVAVVGLIALSQLPS